jgi:hypothetical protein
MRNLLVAIAVVTMAVTFVSLAPATVDARDADSTSVIYIEKWAATIGGAESKAYRAADNYGPYDEVKKEKGWDPHHIPAQFQYYCRLWIKPVF